MNASFLQQLQNETEFDWLLRPYRERADRIMLGMLLFLLAVCLFLVPLRDTLWSVLLIGLPTLALGLWLVRSHGGELVTRLFMASAFMVFTGLIIHQNAGDIEAHFSAFGLIGVLLYYRDWRTIAMATLVIYLHHLVLGYAQTIGVPVYVFDSDQYWPLFWIHVAYFLPFVLMMGYLSIWLRREGYEDQHVIALARQITRGNLTVDQELPQDARESPLIEAVLMMKTRLLDLLRVMPVPAAVIRIDSETIVNVNEAWARQMGSTEVGASLRETPICSIPGTWDRLMQELNDSPDKLLDKREIRLRYPQGKEAICEVSVILHEEIEPVMAIVTLEDITRRREAEETMKELAYHDMLTGLANRSRLQEAMQTAVRQWREEGRPFAVLMMDLDGFKPINDQYGHDAGDAVLRIVAERLRGEVKRDDLIARLGGDEFVVLLPGCRSTEEAGEVAGRLIDSVTQPIRFESGDEVSVGISVGISHVDRGARDGDQLLKQADTALYEAKRAGKRQFRAHA
ncbi:MAG: diguanylate cyclase domain-containing protein [Guyparkeria sp.]|uniref:diguanylate cyclase domain-containing protein n=1 Tax=Guyparkeria sp. TaxID=2035736 RepID=UPI00397E87FB